MNTRFWLEHFQQNEHRPLAMLTRSVDVEESLRPALIAALQTFFAGETGEGRIVFQARTLLGEAQPEFCEGLRLYIAEEGRHARELSALLRGLGARPREHHQTARVFTFARRAIGFRTKMLVLAAAEVVGIVFYELLVERIASAELRATLVRIVREERAHLLFQRDYLRSCAAPLGTRMATQLTTTALRATTAPALASFALSEKALLRALEVGPAELWERASQLLSWLAVSCASEASQAVLRPTSPTRRSAQAPVRLGRCEDLSVLSG